MFRRDWRQQALVLGLVTAAVVAAVAGSALAVNAAEQNHGFGDANAFVRVEEQDPAAAQAIVDAVRQRFGEVDPVAFERVPLPGNPIPIELRAQDPDGAFSGPLLGLRDGRYPTAAGEIALTTSVADELTAEIGDEVDLGGRTRTLVGEVENPSSLSDDFGLLAPSEGESFTSVMVLIDRTAVGPGVATTDRQPSFGVVAIGDDDAAVAAVVLVVVTLAMALAALVAAAGFVVVAQRRQRQLGLLAALGATERHLRLVMLANGVLVGLVAAVVGGVLGLAVWLVTAPAVETAANHRIDRFDLPWGLLVICLLLAVVASAAAAWWPARTMARQPVMAALARRPGEPTSVHRSVLLALVLFAVGIGAVSAARPLGEVRPLFLIGGVIAVVIGIVLVAPAAIRSLAALADRLPFAPRLALRDLSRYQARAASALAAIALGLGVSIAVVVVAKANEARPDEGNLADTQLLVQSDSFLRRDAAPVPSGGETVEPQDDDAAEVAAAVGATDVVPLEVVRNPDPADGQQQGIGVGQVIDDGFRGIGLPYAATPEVLASLGIDPASIDADADLLTSMDRDDLVLFDPSVRDGGDSETVIQHVATSNYDNGPRLLITPHAIEEHGWELRRVAWLIESDAPLTDAQVSEAREVADRAGLTVQSRDEQDSLAAIRKVATGVGIVLALAIVAMAISLLRGESAQDLRTLAATGATARTRRALTATIAAALAGLGVVLSMAGAYAAIAAAYRADLGRLSPVPTTDLLAIALGLPVAAALAGWLLAGREPKTFTRQALD
jgi:putative ABC transport system permease protein